MNDLLPASDQVGDMEVEQSVLFACQTGDQRAWQSLYLAHRRQVWHTLARILGPGQDLEDLVQIVFLRVSRSISGFKGQARFSTWLHRLTVCVAVDYLRGRKMDRLTMPMEHCERITDSQDDPQQALMRKQTLARLQRALHGMKQSQRELVILADILKVEHEEIGRLLKKKQATVRSSLHYARRELARRLARAQEDRS